MWVFHVLICYIQFHSWNNIYLFMANLCSKSIILEENINIDMFMMLKITTFFKLSMKIDKKALFIQLNSRQQQTWPYIPYIHCWFGDFLISGLCEYMFLLMHIVYCLYSVGFFLLDTNYYVLLDILCICDDNCSCCAMALYIYQIYC